MDLERMKKMTGVEKATALIISLGEDKAASVLEMLKKTDEQALEKLVIHLHNTTEIGHETKIELMRDFHQLMIEKKFSISGGVDYAREVLAKAVGSDESNKLLDRVNTATQDNPFEFMDKAAPEQLLDLLGNEHPQTISLILAHLGADKASQVLQGLESDIQLDVVERIAGMENIAPEVLELLYTSLKTTISSLLDVSSSKVGGTKLMAEILNRIDTTVEQQLMDKLEQKDPELAQEIKELMFVFDDLKYVDKRGIQRIVSTINNDLDVISFALKAASEEVKVKFLDVLSGGASGTVESNMRDIPVSLREALEAQQKILNAATELIKNGDILVDRAGGDEEIMLQ